MQFSLLLRLRLAPGRLGTMAEEWGELRIPGMAPLRVRLGRDGRPLMSEMRRHNLVPGLVYIQIIRTRAHTCSTHLSHCGVCNVNTLPRRQRRRAGSPPGAATTSLGNGDRAPAPLLERTGSAQARRAMRPTLLPWTADALPTPLARAAEAPSTPLARTVGTAAAPLLRALRTPATPLPRVTREPTAPLLMVVGGAGAGHRQRGAAGGPVRGTATAANSKHSPPSLSMATTSPSPPTPTSRCYQT